MEREREREREHDLVHPSSPTKRCFFSILLVPTQSQNRQDENGSKARSAPQARSFLGALKAVKANQKDMPKPTEDSWAKDKHKDSWVAGCFLKVYI